MREGEISQDFKKKSVELQGESPSIMKGDSYFYFKNTCPEVILFDEHRPLAFDKTACTSGEWDKYLKTDKTKCLEHKHYSNCAEFSYYMFNKNNEIKKEKTMNEEIVVFISHGKSDLWKDVSRFIEKKLDIETIILKEQTIRGRVVIEKLEEEVDECNYAIIIMTADDEQKDGEFRARENVIHEIGFLQGTLGRENVLVLKQKEITPFSNISGIVYEEFIGTDIKGTFERIRQELEDFEERLLDEEGEDDEEEDD